MTQPSANPSTTDPAGDAVLGALTDVIRGAVTPEIQHAQAMLLRRLALEGSVIPSRIPAPANITQVGGYFNLLTGLSETDMRRRMLGAALGLASDSPITGSWLPGPTAQPPLTLTRLPNDRPAGTGGAAVPLIVAVREDFAASLAAAVDTAHIDGGLLPLWSPIALPAAASAGLDDLLLYTGRAVLVAPSATLVDPEGDAVVLGRLVADAGTDYQLALRVPDGTAGAPSQDWIGLVFDEMSGLYVERALPAVTLLPLTSVLDASGFTTETSHGAPTSRQDLHWATVRCTAGLLTGISRLGDELALIHPADRIAASSLAAKLDWQWNGTRFAPA